jgi:hypothetical protein
MNEERPSMNRAARVFLAVWLLAAILGAGEQSLPPSGEPPEFVPSEKVPTDSAVAFPVDI